MFVYLDTNIYCRPFDDQSQDRISQESEASAVIVKKIETGEFTLVTSDMLKYEVSQNPSINDREWIFQRLKLSGIYVMLNQPIIALSKLLVNQLNIKSRDAIHIASASIIQSTVYFITCDDGVSNKKDKIRSIEPFKNLLVVNPVDFLEGLS